MRLLLDFRGPFVSDWRDQMCRDNAMLSYSPKDIFSEYLSRQLHLLNALDNNYSTWDRWGDTHNFLGHAAELSRGELLWLAGLFLWIIIHQLLLLWQQTNDQQILQFSLTYNYFVTLILQYLLHSTGWPSKYQSLYTFLPRKLLLDKRKTCSVLTFQNSVLSGPKWTHN